MSHFADLVGTWADWATAVIDEWPDDPAKPSPPGTSSTRSPAARAPAPTAQIADSRGGRRPPGRKRAKSVTGREPER